MKEFRCLARALDVALGGRVTKVVDLQFAQKLAISTACPVASDDSPLNKSSSSAEVIRSTWRKATWLVFGTAARTATTDLRLGVPSISAFDQDLFLNSPDEEL